MIGVGGSVGPPEARLEPGVTAVIPVWDEYVSFLPETLASLRTQTPRPRVILVDNASVTPVGAEGSRVVRSPERLSRGAARNLGLAEVETEQVLFWDADDHLLDGALSAMVAALDGDARVVACRLIERGSGRLHRWPARSTVRLTRFARAFALLELIWHRFPVTRALLRTAEARAAGGYCDSSYAEDWPLAAVLAARGRIRILDRPGVAYRVHDGPRPPRSEIVRNGARARLAVRSDPEAHSLVRRLAPLAAVGQAIVVYALRPVRALFSAR